MAGATADRRYAAVKFFLYTMFGSAFLLVGTIALAFLHAKGGPVTFDLRVLAEQQGMVAATTARWLFLSFAIAFAVKVPLFPVHTWLPDAHTQAPTAGSVILAGVMLKLGTYGFLRFGLYLFPEASAYFAPMMVTLGVIGIIYGAICAAMQKDLKRLVAYSSVAHLGFIALGTFALTTQGLQGGVLQMINHGVSTGALFLLVGMIYERRHTRQISELKGLQKSAPIMAGVFTVVMLSSLGLPGLNGFVGEFLILLGSFITRGGGRSWRSSGSSSPRSTCCGPIQRVFHGEADEPNASFREMSWTEGLVMAPLVALIVFMGVYPKPFLDRIAPSVNRLVIHVERNSDFRQPKVATDGPARRSRRRRRKASDHTACSPNSGQSPASTPRRSRGRRCCRCSCCSAVHWSCSWSGALLPRRTTFGWHATLTIAIAVGSIVGSRAAVVPGARRRPAVGRGQRGPDRRLRPLLRRRDRRVGDPRRPSDRRLPPPRGPRRPRAVRAPAALGIRRPGHGLGERPHRDVPRSRDPLDRRVRPGRRCTSRRMRSAEAALKYFVLGGFSSAFFLYGVAMVYGATGTTNLTKIAQFLDTNVLAEDGLLLAGFALLLVGFGFKIAAVPFHSWSPDVYEGSPSPVVAFMASGVKTAGFAGLLRVFVVRLLRATGWTGSPSSMPSPSSRCWSVPCWPSCRRTSNGCWRTPRSATPASSWSACEAANERGLSERHVLPGGLHPHGGRQLRRGHDRRAHVATTTTT